MISKAKWLLEKLKIFLDLYIENIIYVQCTLYCHRVGSEIVRNQENFMDKKWIFGFHPRVSPPKFERQIDSFY